MYSEEIPQDQWRNFLDDFSHRHVGQPVTLELLDDDLGDQPEAVELPHVGVSLDPKDSAGEIVEIIVGGEPSADVNHIVRRASRVRIAKTDQGDDQALEIEARDEPTVLLRFGSSPYPNEDHGPIGTA